MGVTAASLWAVGPDAALAQSAEASPLEEIIVTASIIETPRRQLGTAVSVISGDDIELRGYNSLVDVLRTQPAIGISNTGGLGKQTTLRIRGEEGYRTLLMIDGVKSTDPSGTQQGPNFSSLLATGDLERVEILRGPQGFIYGADAGGVVNILTRTGAGRFGGRVGLESGAFGTNRVDASIAGGSEGGDYFVSVSDVETDGFNARVADNVLADDDGDDNTTLHAKLGWNATENVRVQLVARDIDAKTMFDGCFHPVSFTTVHDCIGTNEQTTYKLSATVDSGKLGHSFGYSDIDIRRDNLASGISSYSTSGQLGRFEYTGTYEPSDSATMVYGLDLQTEKVGGDTSRERDQNGFYFEYQGELGDSFFLSVGARHDDNEDFGTHTSSRLSAAYVQDLGGGSSLKYRASLGTGFRAPSLFEVSYNQRSFGVLPAAAAAPLREETSKGYDIGIEYDAASGLHFEATYFDQEIEDVIDYEFDPVTFDDGYLQTPGVSSSTGIELAAQVPIGERLEFIANWTNNDTETAEHLQRVRRPKNLGNLGLMYSALDERLRFIANYRISRDAIDNGNVPLDDYELLDLSLSYSVNERLEVHGRIENATDENYMEVLGYNTADRAAYAGVRFRF